MQDPTGSAVREATSVGASSDAGPPQVGTAPSGGSAVREATSVGASEAHEVASVGASAAAKGRPEQGSAPSGGSEAHEVASVGARILVVKLSSLGDVVHTMPAVQDIRRAMPGALIDWVVEPGFAPLVRRCGGVQRVIECGLRQWRKSPLSASTRKAWRAFKADLQAQRYDAVIDLQGLTKSALVSRLARLAPGGKRYALANQTEGSSYEAPTRWLADVAVTVTAHSHAVQRSRELCARALGYAASPGGADFEDYGLLAHAGSAQVAIKKIAIKKIAMGGAERGVVVLVHGTSRADKLWPEDAWTALGERLLANGFGLALPHGTSDELARSERLALALAPAAAAAGAVVDVWPRLGLDALTDRLAQAAGVIGVDSGLSHIAVALGLPHVQLYNVDTAWRTGPSGFGPQQSVFALPQPGLEMVWHAWYRVWKTAWPNQSLI